MLHLTPLLADSDHLSDTTKPRGNANYRAGEIPERVPEFVGVTTHRNTSPSL